MISYSSINAAPQYAGNRRAVLYLHGKGGNALEAEHYRPLFPECAVFGLDYKNELPWLVGAEIEKAVGEILLDCDGVCEQA